mgnify:CR=1 FL=1
MFIKDGGRPTPLGTEKESPPHRLPRVVIGILPDDDGFDILGRSKGEGVENQIPGRINDLVGVFLFQKGMQRFAIGFLGNGVEEIFPIRNHGHDYRLRWDNKPDEDFLALQPPRPL